MFQGSSKATAAAAAAAVAAGVVIGKALSQEDALLRLRLRLAQLFKRKEKAGNGKRENGKRGENFLPLRAPFAP